MAIYHCSMKVIGRSSGRTAVSAAAYRAGENLLDEETKERSDYSRKKGVVYSEIMLPDNAPREYADRETLWNAVQKVEKAADAQLAREVEVALPRELTLEQQIILLRLYIMACFVSKGMIADFAIHDKGDGNPHAHILLTMRAMDEQGKWDLKERKTYALDENGQKIPEIDPETGEQKVRIRKRNGRESTEKIWKRITVQANDWNDHGNAEIWRAAWAEHCNQFLAPEAHIDHRSFERQGIDRIPTIHEGAVARKMEAAGLTSERCELNRQVVAANEANQRLTELQEELVANQKEAGRINAGLESVQAEIAWLLAEIEKWDQWERAEAEKKEIEALRQELQRLRNRETELLADCTMVKTVLVDKDSGDFVKEKVAAANSNTLESKYQEPVTPGLLQRILAALAQVRARIQAVMERLRELLAGNVGDDGTQGGRGAQERTEPTKGTTPYTK